jgi:hypothetical protein
MTGEPCPDCGKKIAAGRRYPLAALNTFDPRPLRLAGTTLIDYRCHGVLRRTADRLAARVGEHPYTVWPDMADHDIADLSVTCDECGQPFIPTRKGHRYCQRKCKDVAGQRLRRQTRPEVAEAARQASRRWYYECHDYALARRREYERAHKDDPEYKRKKAERARRRRHQDPEAYRAWHRDYLARKRKESA